jgi:universal stress protein A
MAFRVEDRPGSIKEVTDVIRSHGGRLVSLLTSYDRAPQGFRNVYVRACGIDRKKLPQMHNEVKQKTQLLYFVDHRENRRVEYIEYLPGQMERHVSEKPYEARTKKVLFCTDFSENSIPARVRAVEYAKALAAELVILHVVSSRILGYPFVENGMSSGLVELHRKIDERAEQELATIARNCGREWGPVKTYLRTGVAAAEIVRFAEMISADLIVMGTHGWSGLKHLILGSTAENVVRTANCPVLIVRSTPIPTQTRQDE